MSFLLVEGMYCDCTCSAKVSPAAGAAAGAYRVPQPPGWNIRCRQQGNAPHLATLGKRREERNHNCVYVHCTIKGTSPATNDDRRKSDAVFNSDSNGIMLGEITARP